MLGAIIGDIAGSRFEWHSDTIAAICGGIAEAYYGIPTEIRKHALTFLDQRLIDILNEFEAIYGMTAEKVIKRISTVQCSMYR